MVSVSEPEVGVVTAAPPSAACTAVGLAVPIVIQGLVDAQVCPVAEKAQVADRPVDRAAVFVTVTAPPGAPSPPVPPTATDTDTGAPADAEPPLPAMPPPPPMLCATIADEPLPSVVMGAEFVTVTAPPALPASPPLPPTPNERPILYDLLGAICVLLDDALPTPPRPPPPPMDCATIPCALLSSVTIPPATVAVPLEPE